MVPTAYLSTDIRQLVFALLAAGTMVGIAGCALPGVGDEAEPPLTGGNRVDNQAPERQLDGGPVLPNDSETLCLGEFVSQGSIEKAQLTPFWLYDAASVTADTARSIIAWYETARFLDVSPWFGSAAFMRGPVGQSVAIDSFGRLTFYRWPDDLDPHTMLEVSIGKDPSRGGFVESAGYRAMRLGVPYQLDLRASVEGGGKWWAETPWAVVLQGHAIPDADKRGTKFNPPFAVVVARGRWELHIRADERPSLPADRKYRRFDRFDLGPVVEGRSLDLSVRVVWGYRNEMAAMAVWVDGRPVVSEINRRNFYRTISRTGEAMGPYITFGLYMPIDPTKVEVALAKFSYVRISGGSWAEIPGGTAACV